MAKEVPVLPAVIVNCKKSPSISFDVGVPTLVVTATFSSTLNVALLIVGAVFAAATIAVTLIVVEFPKT